ncbi:DUF4936 family protein [Craterilacuibacter sp. RT1T]|uniref:DUF4936 family protein n=1 Tax=Craterilacuibacter sp. RT1T TaxID=2942211 RepID=UPI0020BFFBA0|nr:DUF4936 family protein [Craterilacuibacter sp. RT1T]MCL6261976.1 DUF4936 family protein [Craterilacuibacter sp. RT1T]
MASLYIYYRPLEATAALAQKISTMQAALALESGIHGQLLRRCDDGHTWMEVYPGIKQREAFGHALAQLLACHGLDEACGERHTEWFECWPLAGAEN